MQALNIHNISLFLLSFPNDITFLTKECSQQINSVKFCQKYSIFRPAQSSAHPKNINFPDSV